MFLKKNLFRTPIGLLSKQKSSFHAQQQPTIFDKIVSRQIPAKIVYEDDKVLAFHDVNPQYPVHILVIPKERDNLSMLEKAEERNKDILGHLLVATSKIARQENLDEGYRVVINNGKNGGQTVYHLHIHLVGGVALGWPPGAPGNLKK